MKICRLAAKQWPEVEREIDLHCDEIERLITDVSIKDHRGID
jgi:hypothetical protein